jgi:serine/threonine-protein kinase RsbW
MTRSIEFTSHPANLARVRSFVREFLGTLSFSPAENDLMVLGIDEACTNIIRYAYDHELTQPIQLCCESGESGVRFRLRDFGAPVQKEKLVLRPLDGARPGGLGLHLIRKAFDAVDYKSCPVGTELTLSKNYSAAGKPA